MNHPPAATWLADDRSTPVSIWTIDRLVEAVFVVLFAIVFPYNIVVFAKRRRCRKCNRWFGGRHESSRLSGVQTQTRRADPLAYRSRFSRDKTVTTTSGTRHVSARCRRRGHRWTYSTRRADLVCACARQGAARHGLGCAAGRSGGHRSARAAHARSRDGAAASFEDRSHRIGRRSCDPGVDADRRER